MQKNYRPYFPESPYFVSIRCYWDNWFGLPAKFVWDVYSEYLHFVSYAYGLRIYAAALVKGKLYFIGQCDDLSTPARYLFREVGITITKQADRINTCYGGHHRRSALSTQIAFDHAYKYLLRLPVDAGLCDRAENYPFSTLSGLLGRERLIVPALAQDELIQETEAHLKWLNTPFEKDHRDQIRTALRRGSFQLRKNQDNKPSEIEFVRS